MLLKSRSPSRPSAAAILFAILAYFVSYGGLRAGRRLASPAGCLRSMPRFGYEARFIAALEANLPFKSPIWLQFGPSVAGALAHFVVATIGTAIVRR